MGWRAGTGDASVRNRRRPNELRNVALNTRYAIPGVGVYERAGLTLSRFVPLGFDNGGSAIRGDGWL